MQEQNERMLRAIDAPDAGGSANQSRACGANYAI